MLTRLGLALFWLLHFLPLALLAPIGRGLVWILYALGRERRNVAFTNLRMCFPQWTEEERRRRVQEQRAAAERMREVARGGPRPLFDTDFPQIN